MENKTINSLLAEVGVVTPEVREDLHSAFDKLPVQIGVMAFLVAADIFGYFGVLNSIFVELTEWQIYVLTVAVSAMTLVSGVFIGKNIKMAIDEHHIKVFSAIKAAGLASVVVLVILASIACRKATHNGLVQYKDVVDWQSGVYFMGALLLASFAMTIVMSVTKESE